MGDQQRQSPIAAPPDRSEPEATPVPFEQAYGNGAAAEWFPGGASSDTPALDAAGLGPFDAEVDVDGWEPAWAIDPSLLDGPAEPEEGLGYTAAAVVQALPPFALGASDTLRGKLPPEQVRAIEIAIWKAAALTGTPVGMVIAAVGAGEGIVQQLQGYRELVAHAPELVEVVAEVLAMFRGPRASEVAYSLGADVAGSFADELLALVDMSTVDVVRWIGAQAGEILADALLALLVTHAPTIGPRMFRTLTSSVSELRGVGRLLAELAEEGVGRSLVAEGVDLDAPIGVLDPDAVMRSVDGRSTRIRPGIQSTSTDCTGGTGAITGSSATSPTRTSTSTRRGATGSTKTRPWTAASRWPTTPSPSVHAWTTWSRWEWGRAASTCSPG